MLKGFYIDDKWELVNESEEESLKFNYKINVGRIRALLKGTRPERAAHILQKTLSQRQHVHELNTEDYHTVDKTFDKAEETAMLSPKNENNVLVDKDKE